MRDARLYTAGMSHHRLLLATTNAGKIGEFRTLLKDCGWELVTPDEAGISLDVEETGVTYEENALLKARVWAEATALPALADDSGLEVDALDGGPGLYSARYAGHDTTHADKIKVLLAAIATEPDERRGARFRAVLAVVFPDGRSLTAEGVCEGAIASVPRGQGGFGYDPVFLVDGLGRTMAELDASEKNRLSHRASAARRLCAALRDLADDDTASPPL